MEGSEMPDIMEAASAHPNMILWKYKGYIEENRKHVLEYMANRCRSRPGEPLKIIIDFRGLKYLFRHDVELIHDALSLAAEYDIPVSVAYVVDPRLRKNFTILGRIHGLQGHEAMFENGEAAVSHLQGPCALV
jgi:hypothetical protein